MFTRNLRANFIDFQNNFTTNQTSKRETSTVNYELSSLNPYLNLEVTAYNTEASISLLWACQEMERRYFYDHLPDVPFEIIDSNPGEFSSYLAMQRSKFGLTLSSNVAYEMAAQGVMSVYAIDDDVEFGPLEEDAKLSFPNGNVEAFSELLSQLLANYEPDGGIRSTHFDRETTDSVSLVNTLISSFDKAHFR